MPVTEISEITEAAQTSAPSPKTQVTQRIEDSPLDKIRKEAENINNEEFSILKGKQQLWTRKKQIAEPTPRFLARKLSSLLTNGLIEITTLSHEINKESSKKIENARESEEKGAAQKVQALHLLGKIPTSLFIYPGAFITATVDALFAVDTAGRRSNAGKFPEWQDVHEAEKKLANATTKLAEDAQKLINEGKLSAPETRKLASIKKHLETKTKKLTAAAENSAKIALIYPPAKAKTSALVASSGQSADDTTSTESLASPSQSFQENLPAQSGPTPQSTQEIPNEQIVGKKRNFMEFESNQPAKEAYPAKDQPASSLPSFQQKLIGQKRNADGHVKSL